MNKCLLSIIVPVFNAGIFLPRCFESLTRQMGDIEIIFVDDGSTDMSGELCDLYEKMDERVVVIHQENQGVSKARNAALDILRGEYFTFVDADDWIEPNFCEKMFPYLFSLNYEMILFSRYFNTDLKEYFLHPIVDNLSVYSVNKKEDIVASTIGFCDESEERDNDIYGLNACKIYRTTVLKDTRYREGICFGEDTLFALEMIIKTNNFLCLPDRYYHYYIHDESATHKENEDVTSQVLHMMELMSTIVKDAGIEGKQIDQAFAQRYIYKMFFCIDLRVIKGMDNRSIFDNRKRLKEITRETPFAKSIKKVKKRRLRKKIRIKLFLLRSRLYITYLTLIKLRSRPTR